MTMLAFVDTEISKADVLKQLRAHAMADEIVKGRYWENGKGCAVGCTIHCSNHALYEPRFGIPKMLANLEDRIFEGLPNDRAKEWPIEFMSAVKPGSDLSCVGWQFLHWLLTDEDVNPGINHPIVKDAIKQCADVLVPLTKGLPVDRSAASAADAAAGVGWSVARAADAAAGVALGVAWSVARAACAADAAAGVGWSVTRAADAAASVALAAWAADAAYVKMSKKLLVLIKAAPIAKAESSNADT